MGSIREKVIERVTTKDKMGGGGIEGGREGRKQVTGHESAYLSSSSFSLFIPVRSPCTRIILSGIT